MRAVLALAIVAAATTQARAECGIPTWMGTWTDSPIPTQGSLYMYVDNLRVADLMPALGWHGVGNAEAIRISSTVIRIDYSGADRSTLEVKPIWGESWTYTLDARWHPEPRVPRLIQYWHDESSWTCSHTDAVMVQVDQETAAFRVDWTPIDGVTHEYILPARTDTGRSALELGKINCGGETIPLDELVRGGHLELTAIRIDRSEVRVIGSPGLVFLDRLASRTDGLDGALLLQARHFEPPPGVDSPAARRGTSNAIVVLLILGLGLAIAWRTRIRAAETAS